MAHITRDLATRGGYTVSDWETSDPQENTHTLDAGGQGRVAYVDSDISVTPDSLLLTGGDTTGLDGAPLGNARVGARPCLASIVVD